MRVSQVPISESPWPKKNNRKLRWRKARPMRRKVWRRGNELDMKRACEVQRKTIERV